MRKVLFYERQSLSRVAFVAAILSGVIGLIAILPAPGDNGPVGPLRGLSGLALLLIAVVVLNLLTMTTWVYEDEIRVQFGRLVPYYNKHIPLEIISEVRSIDTASLQNAGRPGIRSGVFEGEETRILTARGCGGVFLQSDRGPLIVGTQYPDAFIDAVESARLQNAKI